MRLKRDIAITVPHYMVAPWWVQDTDLIVTVPGRVAKTLSRVLPLATYACPVQAEQLKVNMIWHGRFDDDPSHRWLRNLLIGLKSAY